MKPRRSLVAWRLLMAGALVLGLAACGDEQNTSSTAEPAPPSIPTPPPQAAYLTAAGGEVHGADSVVDLSVGDLLTANRTVSVASESFADIQFGTRAVARVFGPASASVRTPPAGPAMELLLNAGSTSILVNPLDEGETFLVRTPRVVYRVVGTQFHVSTGEAERVAVGEGAVAVLPGSLDIPELLNSRAAEDAGVRDALATLELATPRVTANQQGFVDADALGESDKLAAQLAEKLRQIEAAQIAARPSLVDELRGIVRATSETLGNLVVLEPTIADDVAEKLARTDELRLLPVSKDPQNTSLLAAEDVSNLVKFTLRTVPQTADIYINDAYVGQSVYRGVLRASDSLSIRVTRDGYRERRIYVDRARSEVLTVQLERLPPSISASSFIKAIRADDLATVRTYVQEGGSVDVRTEDNLPAVVLASGLVPVLRGQTPDLSYHREILRTIVAAGANVDAAFVVEGSTFRLLHAAVLAGVAGFDVEELVQLFLDAGADVDGTIALEGEELTPLAVAVRWALFTGETQEDLLKVLLRAGASLDVAISYEDELLTLREIAANLISEGELVDSELIRLLEGAGVSS
jgi:hypothetical protein